MSVNPTENANPVAPLNPDFGGYPDAAGLLRGYRESSAEAQRLRERADRAEALLTQMVANGANPRAAVPDRRGNRAEDRLTEFGVPVDALNEYVGEKVREGVQEAFKPIVNGMGARETVVRDHPDYVQFEHDVSNFINADPSLSKTYADMFAVNPAGAIEFAFLKFGDSRRRASPAPTDGGGGNPVDASIPSSRAGEGRRAPDTNHALQEAMERFQRTGSRRDAEAYAKLRLHSVITDAHLSGA